MPSQQPTNLKDRIGYMQDENIALQQGSARQIPSRVVLGVGIRPSISMHPSKSRHTHIISENFFQAQIAPMVLTLYTKAGTIQG